MFISHSNFLSALWLQPLSWDHCLGSSRPHRKTDPFSPTYQAEVKWVFSRCLWGYCPMLHEWASWGIVLLRAPSVLGAYCQQANGAQPLTFGLESAPLGLLEKWCLGRGLGMWVITAFCPLKKQGGKWAEDSDVSQPIVHYGNCRSAAQLPFPLQIFEQRKK